MADSKSNYSNNSKKYINKTVPNSLEAQKDYYNSKKQEERFNDRWKRYTVDINDVVEKFDANSKEYVNGYKYIFEGDRYQVIADMVSGYLRILDKKTHQHVKLDGKPGSNDETHLKIKKRGEM